MALSPDDALPRSPFCLCVAPGSAPDKVFPPPMQTIAASICLSAAATTRPTQGRTNVIQKH
jgi:hypothetical protein